MAVWSTIKLKDLEYTRVDAEFYQPKYINELHVWNNVKKRCSVVKLRNIISKPVRTGHTPKSRNFKVDDIPIAFIKTNTLREGKIEYSNVEFLPQRCLSTNDYIENYSSIVTIIGATKEIVGRVAIKEPKDPISTTNQNVAIINYKLNIDPYFATIYLQSKFGRDQLWRHSRQTEQVNLNCREVERVLFPLFDFNIQERIGGLVRTSFELQQKSQSLYSQATQLLEQELGLDKISFEKPRSYKARFSEVIDFSRFDGEHYQPKYQKYSELIMAYSNGYERLLSNVKAIKSDYQLKKHPENIINYIELSKINAGLGVIENIGSIDKKEAPSRAKRLVKQGDILASSVVGSVEKSALVSELEDGYIASNGFFQFRSDVYSPEFLLILVKSQLFKEQLHQQSTGGILSAVGDQNLRYLIIPKLPKELQDEITDKVSKSHQMNRESKALLEQAKSRIEELIEQPIQANA